MVKKPKKQQLSQLKTAAPLLTRTAVFLAIFVIFTGIIGPRIISHGLVNRDGFQVYGGAGKALLFGVLALVLLISRNKTTIQFKKWDRINVLWFLGAIASFYAAWYSIDKLISGNHSLSWIVLAHFCLVLSIALVALAVFGFQSANMLVATYKNEIYISIGLAIAFFIFLYIVYGLWQVLSAAVLHSVQWLMNRIGIHSTFVPPRTLLYNKFGINIAQYCSGIESIALFTAVYALIGVLDWDKFNHKRYLWIFPIGLGVLFLLNILRVFVLILGGYFINQQIAFSLFHTYTGMLFFIFYSILFWGVSYKWMLQKD